MSLYAQHLFMYLLTCEHINISGVFELPDVYICFESKLNIEQLQQAKKELEGLDKVKFKDGWVFVVNAQKNNKYRNAPDNEKVYEKEIQQVPKNILDYFDTTSTHRGSTVDSSVETSVNNSDTSVDSSVNTSVHTTGYSSYNSELITHNQEIINNNSELRNNNSELITQEPDLKKPTKRRKKFENETVEPPPELLELVGVYNEVFNGNTSSTEGFLENYLFWRTKHDHQKIIAAIRNAINDQFWRDKLTLTKLFRKRNPRGEKVDYIEDLANRQSDRPPNVIGTSNRLAIC